MGEKIRILIKRKKVTISEEIILHEIIYKPI